MKKLLCLIVSSLFLLIADSVQAAEKVIFTVEEIRSMPYSEMDKIWEVLETTNLSYDDVYDSLKNEYLTSTIARNEVTKQSLPLSARRC